MAAELHHPHADNSLPLPELPNEIIFYNILPRLPVKSVYRYTCVSKQWHATLTTPFFKKLHFSHIVSKDEHDSYPKKLLFSTEKEPCKFYSVDSESRGDVLTALPDLTFGKIYPYDQPEYTIHVLTSFHGLVCLGIEKFGVRESKYSDLMLWNPLTHEYKTLPKGHYMSKCYQIRGSAFSLYYSSQDDDYKLLRLNSAYLYSLKYNSWKKLGSLMKYFKDVRNYIKDIWWPGVWLNRKLYFLREIFKSSTSGPPVFIILMYDTKTERFIEIPTPPFEKEMWWTTVLSFSVVRGCIHLCVGREMEMEIWRMDGDGEWMRVVSNSQLSCLDWNERRVAQVERNVIWLMHSVFDGNFCEFDLKKRIKEYKYSISYYYTIGSTKLKFSNMNLKGKYIETFVSPNQYDQ